MSDMPEEAPDTAISSEAGSDPAASSAPAIETPPEPPTLAPSVDLASSPLATVAPDDDAIRRVFDADPRELTDRDRELLVTELRRRRKAFVEKEAAEALAKVRKSRSKATPSAALAAALDKPLDELSLDDLEKANAEGQSEPPTEEGLAE